MGDNTIRAMIVDDEEALRGILQIALTYFGVKVVAEAGNGEEAVQRYREASPNVVLMDINMPVMNGFTCLEEILKINPDAVVLLMTGSLDEDAMEKGRQKGARGFLRKPLVMDELHRDILANLRIYFAKEQGVTLEPDYFKYVLKPGFRPEDENKPVAPPPIYGATHQIRERQKRTEAKGSAGHGATAAVRSPGQATGGPVVGASSDKSPASPQVQALERDLASIRSELDDARREVEGLRRVLFEAAASMRSLADDITRP